tara:strand:- start:390 stop:665 length:276 start_codon:yes stop_codon:yes gene_type:complete
MNWEILLKASPRNPNDPVDEYMISMMDFLLDATELQDAFSARVLKLLKGMPQIKDDLTLKNSLMEIHSDSRILLQKLERVKDWATLQESLS